MPHDKRSSVRQSNGKRLERLFMQRFPYTSYVHGLSPPNMEEPPGLCDPGVMWKWRGEDLNL